MEREIDQLNITRTGRGCMETQARCGGGCVRVCLGVGPTWIGEGTWDLTGEREGIQMGTIREIKSRK